MSRTDAHLPRPVVKLDARMTHLLHEHIAGPCDPGGRCKTVFLPGCEPPYRGASRIDWQAIYWRAHRRTVRRGLSAAVTGRGFEDEDLDWLPSQRPVASAYSVRRCSPRWR